MFMKKIMVTISGPPMSGKTHVAMLVTKALRDAGVSVREPEEDDSPNALYMRRAAVGLVAAPSEAADPNDMVGAVKRELDTVAKSIEVEIHYQYSLTR